jgi:hypothetical protein
MTITVTFSLIVSASAASAGSLSQDDVHFINGYVISRMILLKCREKGYVSDDDKPMKIADKLGVDGVRIWDAARAAMMVILDQDYDRKDIIPEVTQAVRAAMQANLDDAKTGKICKYTGTFEELGWIKKE